MCRAGGGAALLAALLLSGCGVTSTFATTRLEDVTLTLVSNDKDGRQVKCRAAYVSSAGVLCDWPGGGEAAFFRWWAIRGLEWRGGAHDPTSTLPKAAAR